MKDNLEQYFVDEVKKYNMTDPLEVLNWYRNLYYKEETDTERRLVAEAINNLFVKYKIEILRGNTMVRVYTDEWNGFQFRAPVYLDGHFEPYQFDLVKWEEHKPYKVIDLETGKEKNEFKSCFSVGRLIWNPKGDYFDFESCGLRYLEYRIDGLEKFILDFCKTMEMQLVRDDD